MSWSGYIPGDLLRDVMHREFQAGSQPTPQPLVDAVPDELRALAKVDWPERPGWDEYFMGIARAVAARSDCERDRVGAVVVKDQRIRATGYNGAPAGRPGCSTCPRRTSGCESGSSYDNCVAVHAEANALLYCDREDLVGADLYITRKPCYACAKLIAAAGIINVHYPEST